MMGFKERTFHPLVAVSLEELVPQNHFYRHLQKVVDLSFVYDLVRESYSLFGRPSIDPIVFFKLQLVMFFEDIRSERLLMRQVADRLSVRWYVGYDLDEPLPDHSTTLARSVCAMASQCFGASLKRSLNSVKRRSWCGGRNCT
jgi:transposase